MRATFLIAAAALLSCSAAQAQIVNGSFEDGVDPGTFSTVNVGQNNITGWDVTSGSVDYIGSYWQASNGSRSVDLSGVSIGTLAQTISGLTVGQSYRVSFDVSRNPDGGDTPRTGTFTAGAQSFGFSYSNTGNSFADMQWETVSYTFLATAGSSIISFASDASGGCCFGPALDNVRIAAVPEPATWALMITGFGLAGAAVRRRSAAAVAIA